MVVLQRNFRSYLRSYGNVLARMALHLVASLIVGMAFLNAGKGTGPLRLRNILCKCYQWLVTLRFTVTHEFIPLSPFFRLSSFYLRPSL